MSKVLALYRVSVRQALPLRRSILLAILELAPAAIYLLATGSRTEEAAFQGLIEVGSSIYLALVMPVVAIVLAAGVLGNERRDLTLSFIVLRPMPRSAIAAAKVTAAASAAIVLNLVGAIALGVAHLVRYGGGTSVLVGLVAAAVIGTIAYVSVFVPLGFITDRAVIIGLAYLLVFENGVIFALTGLAVLSPWRLAAAVLSGMVDGADLYLEGAIGALTAGDAVLVMAIYAGLGIAASTLLLRRRDLA